MNYRGIADQCRRCGHRRGEHRDRLVGFGKRICEQTGACRCTGFSPAHLSWDVFAAEGEWSVQSRETGKTWPHLPTQRAADELARSLTDIDELLARINADAAQKRVARKTLKEITR